MPIQKTKVIYRFVTAVAVLCSAAFFPSSTRAQQTFESPALAAEAFVDAVATGDAQALASMLGSDWKTFIPTDNIDQEDMDAFLAAWEKTHRFKSIAYGKVQLAVGAGDWTLPIPIVKKGERWRFDTLAGAEEMRIRRIGHNELSVMQALLAYYDAQKEYALADQNGDGMLEYARLLVSSPGRHDGLYWPGSDGEPESPLGPLFGSDTPGNDYHGYYFKILTEQGADAPGGGYDYLINERMAAGFALVAWPVTYGDSGVMTFLVSHDGRVYQNDLGAETDQTARAMTRFNPDSSWKTVLP
jgi:hypothetical protein